VVGIMGILLMLVSVVMASQNFVIPQTGREMSVLANSSAVVAVSGVVFLFIAFGFSRWMGDIPVLNKLALSPPTSDDETAIAKDAKQPIATAGPVGVGDWGVAESPLRPAGRAKFGPAFVDVVADGSYVAAGEQIRVISIEGNRVVVRPVEQA
jgi:membrane-bound serine protease (ClpP class)